MGEFLLLYRRFLRAELFSPPPAWPILHPVPSLLGLCIRAMVAIYFTRSTESEWFGRWCPGRVRWGRMWDTSPSFMYDLAFERQRDLDSAPRFNHVGLED